MQWRRLDFQLQMGTSLRSMKEAAANQSGEQAWDFDQSGFVIGAERRAVLLNSGCGVGEVVMDNDSVACSGIGQQIRH